MSALDQDRPHVTRAADRTQLRWAGRTTWDVVLGADETAGAIALLDQRGEHGDVTPMHVHRSEAEVFYVLEGQITAWAGSDVHTVDAGGAVYLPAGQPHALGVSGDRARIITVTAPGGFARFVRAAGVPVAEGAPATWEFDVDRLLQAAPEHSIDIVGPPPPLPASS